MVLFTFCTGCRQTENSNLNNPGNSTGSYAGTKQKSLPADLTMGGGKKGKSKGGEWES